MHQSHLKDNFYTYEEIRDFTNNFSDRNIINISKFIESKTRRKYIVVEKQLVCDLHRQVLNNNKAILNINKFLEDVRYEIQGNNHALLKKWEDILNELE